VRVDATGVGVPAGQVLLLQEGQQLAPAAVGGGGDLRDLQVGEGFAVVVDPDGLVADQVFVDFVGDGFEAGGPVAEEFQRLGVQGLDGVVVALPQGQQRFIDL